MRPQDDHALRSLLQDEAERHQPDREAMLARINRRRGTPRRGVMSWLFQPVGPGARRVMAVARPAAAAAAVAGVLVAGVTGINLADRAPEPGLQAAGPPSTAPASPPPSRSVPPGARDGYLTATAVRNSHSIPSWSQNDLTLATTEQITALDVTLRVARTPGVADTGHWSTIPKEMITTGVTTTAKELVYRFTLNPGATLAPGSYTFAAQYNHEAGNRSVSADTYDATTTATAAPAHTKGRFTS
ncbi:hypothetical protein [Paractinoplanes rishiriensis]|uniref:Uncharacterized protein n=1 Tax=Paractinoplanes rishiriensis TaxID=1050105 RepID=A0A919JSQ2_9ACTN|nr:hypothetical protein [Actinoplanes rishiriensis]GIE92995.1 hypothetical protein Ari01nite_04600 [Actinoplanes rishiriensis]